MKSPNKTQRNDCVAHCEFGFRIAPRFLDLRSWIWATGWRYSLAALLSKKSALYQRNRRRSSTYYWWSKMD